MKTKRTSKYGNKDVLDWERMIAEGENPKGFTGQYPNGTGHATGTGWNKQYDYEIPQCEPDATRPAGRHNRTAE